MRRAAARLQIGVNGLPGTPHLGRVVEMAALTQALRAAFGSAADGAGGLLVGTEAAMSVGGCSSTRHARRWRATSPQH